MDERRRMIQQPYLAATGEKLMTSPAVEADFQMACPHT